MRWKHTTAALIACASLAAHAQSQTATNTIYLNGVADSSTAIAKMVGRGNCGDRIQVTWTPGSTILCSSPIAWITTGSCREDGPATSDISLSVGTDGRSASFLVSDLPNFQAADGGGTTCGGSGNYTDKVCGSYKISNSFLGDCGSTRTVLMTGATIKYKGSPPAVPVIEAVISQDSALTVRCNTNNDSDTIVIHVDVRAAGDTDFQLNRGDIRPPDTKAKVDHLINNVTYDVQARSEDAAGNISDPTPPQQGTPLKSDGFWDVYKQFGGQEQGGCGSVPGGLIFIGGPLLALLGLFRRKRSCRR